MPDLLILSGMNVRYTALLAFIFCILMHVNAQIHPLPGAKLNYTQVMFEYEKVRGAGVYIIQLIEDTAGVSFEHPLMEQKDSSTATLITGLQFGKKYQWRYAGIKDGQAPVWKGPYRFETLTDSLLYHNLVKISVTKNENASNAGGLIINDCTHSITDRNGNLVWYLPKVTWRRVLEKKNLSTKPQIFDLRLNPYGTITYLADSTATECDLDGNKLWRAPNDGKVSGGTSESYNHDFKRLPNGHYMVLSNQLSRRLPPYKDTVLVRKKYTVIQAKDDGEYGKVEFPLVIEYDKKGKVAWSWNGENYLDPDPFMQRKDSVYFFELKPHVNAFSTDKKNEFVYVGLRNLNRIIKIEKKTGKVVDAWGDKRSSSSPAKYVALNRQHDANILDDGTIAVFNNNDYPGLDSFARVLILSQQARDSNSVIWSFDCDFDSVDRHAPRTGGNVDQLKNGNLLVCMGTPGRIFEVTRDKKIVWSATVIPNGRTGDIFFHRLYRAHYVSSLYPCYFTISTNDDTLAAGLSHLKLKIFNKGSENDSYEVRILSSSGNYIKQFTTAEIASNRSASLDIKPDYQLRPGDLVEISVSSVTNPDFQRKSLLRVKK